MIARHIGIALLASGLVIAACAADNSLSDSLDAPMLDRSSLAWSEPGAKSDAPRVPDEPDAATETDAGDAGADSGGDAGDASSEDGGDSDGSSADASEPDAGDAI